MSEEKTLSQIYNEAWNENELYGESRAAACAAVARHVVAEMLAAHVAECHAKPADPPQPEAGDWAMEAWNAADSAWRRCISYDNTKKGDDPTREDNISAAKVIRDASERHYGPIITRATLDRNAAQRERDAALRNRCDHCGAKTIDDCIRCGAPQCCPQCCKITTLEAERDALRRERDEERKQANIYCNEVESLRNCVEAAERERDEAKNSATASQLEHARRLEQRAESAEAALGELRAACEWITCSGCSPLKGKDGRWRSMFLPYDGIEAATLADAILAAYRNHKAASAAEWTAIAARGAEQKETTT